METSKFIVKILVLTFKYAQWMGLIVFNIKGDTISNVNWLVWLSVIIRLINLCVVIVAYTTYILEQDFIMKFIHVVRLFVCIYSSYFIVKLQLFHASEIVKMVKGFLGLFRKIRLLSRENEFNFGRSRALMTLLSVSCLIHDSIYRLTLKNLILTTFKDVAINGSFAYIFLGTTFLYHVHILVYLLFGYLYSELNRIIRVSLKHQLRNLEHQSHQRAPTKLKTKLKKCLNLHREIFETHILFQKLFQCITILAFIQKSLLVGSLSYTMFIELKLWSVWYPIAIGTNVLDLFLLTYAVDIARDQFSMIRWIHPDMYNIGHFEELHILVS